MSDMYMVITTYHFKDRNDCDFAQAITFTMKPHWSILLELNYIEGETKMRKLSEDFNVPIKTREYETTLIHEVTVPLS